MTTLSFSLALGEREQQPSGNNKNRSDPMNRTMDHTRPITLLVCALGGEGGGVLTEWLVDTARHAGYAAQSTSIPGVAMSIKMNVMPLCLVVSSVRTSMKIQFANCAPLVQIFEPLMM